MHVHRPARPCAAPHRSSEGFRSAAPRPVSQPAFASLAYLYELANRINKRDTRAWKLILAGASYTKDATQRPPSRTAMYSERPPTAGQPSRAPDKQNPCNPTRCHAARPRRPPPAPSPRPYPSSPCIHMPLCTPSRPPLSCPRLTRRTRPLTSGPVAPPVCPTSPPRLHALSRHAAPQALAPARPSPSPLNTRGICHVEMGLAPARPRPLVLSPPRIPAPARRWGGRGARWTNAGASDARGRGAYPAGYHGTAGGRRAPPGRARAKAGLAANPTRRAPRRRGCH